jgi:hypothetical protein
MFAEPDRSDVSIAPYLPVLRLPHAGAAQAPAHAQWALVRFLGTGLLIMRIDFGPPARQDHPARPGELTTKDR